MASTNSWFGLGFNPTTNAMTDTDMMIFWNQNNTSVTGWNFKGNGLGIPPTPLGNDEQVITILNRTVANGVTTVEVTRPINGKDRKSLGGTIESK